MPSLVLSEARDALVAGGITGPHQSHSRRDNLHKIEALVDGDEEVSFGLSGLTKYSPADILRFLADVTGCSPRLEEVDGNDTVDPERTITGVVAAARRLKDSACRGASLLAVTGHPSGLLEHHIRVVDAYVGAGGKLLRLREWEKFRFGKGQAEVRYVGGVGSLCDGGSLNHTHSAEPMERLLESDPWPEIVLGDHGFAGAAIERGIPTIAVMDINDPALAVAQAEGRDAVVIPMDDYRSRRLYQPSWRLFEGILARLELS